MCRSGSHNLYGTGSPQCPHPVDAGKRTTLCGEKIHSMGVFRMHSLRPFSSVTESVVGQTTNRRVAKRERTGLKSNSVLQQLCVLVRLPADMELFMANAKVFSEGEAHSQGPDWRCADAYKKQGPPFASSDR
jgi:hypothetical protein